MLFQRDFSSGFFHFISIIYFQFELRHKRTAYFHPSDVIIFNGRPSNADRCTSYFCRILCTCNHYRFTVLSIRNSNIEYSMHMRQTVPLFPTAPPDTKKHTQRKKSAENQSNTTTVHSFIRLSFSRSLCFGICLS